jgi:hypothetical protein
MRIARRSLTRSVLTRQRTSASSWLRDWCAIRSQNLIGNASGSFAMWRSPFNAPPTRASAERQRSLPIEARRDFGTISADDRLDLVRRLRVTVAAGNRQTGETQGDGQPRIDRAGLTG